MKHPSPSPTLPTRHPLFLLRLWPWALCAAVGWGAGLLNGLLGAAGGILLVAVLPHLTPPHALCPSLLPLGRYHERRDLLATAMTVMLPVSAVSCIFYYVSGIRPDAELVAVLILPAILGGFIGAKLLGRLSDRLLRRLFAALVVIAGIRMLFG